MKKVRIQQKRHPTVRDPDVVYLGPMSFASIGDALR